MARKARPKTRTPRIPSLRLHKASGQAFVELDGKRHYLGAHGLPETQQRYQAMLGDWLKNGRRLPDTPAQGEDAPAGTPAIVELVAPYWEHCKLYYRDAQGNPTTSLNNVHNALKRLKEHYGPFPASAFGPKALQALRDTWIADGLSRKTVNDRVRDVQRCFKWCVAQELIPVHIYEALRTVEGLRKGRSAAKESRAVKPVPEAHIIAAREHLPSVLRAVVDLQLLTGARSGELLKLRPIDIDTSGNIWTANLEHHKTSHHGKARTLYFGPKAQELLREFLQSRSLQAHLFDPREAIRERRDPGDPKKGRRENQAATPRQTERVVRDHYAPDTYGRAIARACKAAGVPAWHPHQLRHNCGTSVRRQFGLEAAQIILGHSSANITQVYAELDTQRAHQVAQAIG